MPPPRKTAPDCPIERCIVVGAGRWKGMILARLLEGAWRYRALADALRPQVSERALTQALRELEEDGVIERAAQGWRLTERGEGLRPVLLAMAAWGDAAPVSRRVRPAASAVGARGPAGP